MPYPTKYARQYDFQGYQVGNPTRPLPGDKVSADLNALEQSVGEIVDFLKGPIRSDGKLANGSVGVDQLNPNLNLGFSLPTVWEPHVEYTADSTVLYANKFWKSKVAHTSSGGFDESKWDEIVDFGAQADAAAASALAALASKNAAAVSAEATAADRVQTGLDVVATAADRVQTGVDAAAAAASFDSFDDRYLGAKSSDPTLDNDGGSLLVGALYWSTVASALKVYDGTAWQNYGASPGTDLSGITNTAEARENLGLGVSAGLMQLTDAADTTAINAAITALNAAGGGTLRLLKGTYSLTDVALQSNVTVQLEAGVVINQTGGSSSSDVFKGSGATSGSAVALTANIAVGGTTASVADTTGFAAGDYCIVRTNQYLSSPSGRNQEIFRIKSLSSTVFTFTRGATNAFATANSAEIIKLNPIINAQIVGAGEINIGTNMGGGVAFEMGVGCTIGDGLRVNFPHYNGAARLQLCTESQIRNCYVANGIDTASSGEGYGLVLDESCTFCEIYSCISDGVRENTLTNRSRYNKVHDCFALNNTDDGFNTHGADCHHNEFYNLTVEGGGSGIIIGWSAALARDNYNIVRDCIVRNTSGAGFSIGGTSSNYVEHNVIQGCLVENVTGPGIVTVYANECHVLYNRVIMGAATTKGIDSSDGGGITIIGNVVLGDNVTGGLSGIRSSDASEGIIARNSVRNVSTSGGGVSFYVPTGTNVKVAQNDDDSGTVSLSGASVNKFNSWNT